MPKNPLTWKFVLIFAVVAGALAFSIPPKERINLGLDLQGGLHILMQVDTDSATKYELDLRVNRLGGEFKERDLPYSAILPAGPTVLRIRGTDPVRQTEVREILDRQMGQWDIQSAGAGDWVCTMPPQMAAAIRTGAIDAALGILRNRIDSLGVAEPLVQKQGIQGDRILIQLPGVENPERVKKIIGTPELMEWKAVSYPPFATSRGSWYPPGSKEALIAMWEGQIPEDTDLYPQRIATPDGGFTEIWWPLKRVSTIAGPDLRDAYRTSDDWGDPVVAFELTEDAGRRFEQATKEAMGERMAIVLGGVGAGTRYVISAPEIRGVIRTMGEISGGFDLAGAEDLALKLRSGAIPTDVRIIEERTVGPSLGRDSIRAGLAAGLAGFLGVMLFMLLYYRLAGVNAVVALSLNVLLVFGTLAALPFLFSGAQATLTLPGIAGLILTVGMAVDSNVLIFERIREELRIGKTVRAAVEQGFGKAFATILDCNVTTLVAAFFLFSYGTGPVKGFAVTLTIGLLVSMFTAVFVSRQLFELVLLRKERGDTLSI